MTQVNRYITSLSEEVHKMVGDKLGKPYMEAMKEYSKYAKAKNIADNYLTRDQNGLEVFDVNRIRAIAQDSTAGEMGRQFYQMMDEFAGTNIGRNLLDEAIAV
jgi:hypothetical protein